MRKLYIFTGMIFAACLTIGIGIQSVIAGNAIAPVETITIEGKKPVKFSHQIHTELGVSCGECHHNEEHNALTEQEISEMVASSQLQCVSCHNKDFKTPKLQKRKNIFHANCKDCHKKGFADKKGPTKCADCHGKKKRAIEGC